MTASSRSQLARSVVASIGQAAIGGQRSRSGELLGSDHAVRHDADRFRCVRRRHGIFAVQEFTQGFATPEASSIRDDRWALLYLDVLPVVLVTVALAVSFTGWGAWGASEPVFFLGMSVLCLGVVVRQWSHRTLGRFHQAVVTIQTDHQVITRGPYRFVRHPMYMGSAVGSSGWDWPSARGRDSDWSSSEPCLQLFDAFGSRRRHFTTRSVPGTGTTRMVEPDSCPASGNAENGKRRNEQRSPVHRRLPLEHRAWVARWCQTMAATKPWGSRPSASRPAASSITGPAATCWLMVMASRTRRSRMLVE